jgi:hypothetical protein
MVIPVMDHIDSVFATVAAGAVPDEDETEDEDMARGPSLTPATAPTRHGRLGGTIVNTASTSSSSSYAATASTQSHRPGSGPKGRVPSSANTTPSLSSLATLAAHSSSSTTVGTSTTSGTTTPSSAAETDPPPPTYHKAIRAAMTVAKRTLNRYYAKTDDAVLYQIAMGMFASLT